MRPSSWIQTQFLLPNSGKELERRRTRGPVERYRLPVSAQSGGRADENSRHAEVSDPLVWAVARRPRHDGALGAQGDIASFRPQIAGELELRAEKEEVCGAVSSSSYRCPEKVVTLTLSCSVLTQSCSISCGISLGAFAKNKDLLNKNA